MPPCETFYISHAVSALTEITKVTEGCLRQMMMLSAELFFNTTRKTGEL